MKTHSIIIVSGIVSEQWPKPCPPPACMGEALAPLPRFNPDSSSHWNLSCRMASFSFPAPPDICPKEYASTQRIKGYENPVGGVGLPSP